MGDEDSVRLPSELASRQHSHASKSKFSATGSRHIESRDEGISGMGSYSQQGNSTTPSDWHASTRNDRSPVCTSGYDNTVSNAAEDIFWLCTEPGESDKRGPIINTSKLEKALQDFHKRIEHLVANHTSCSHIKGEEPESAIGSSCSMPYETDSANFNCCERESLKSCSLLDYSHHENSNVATVTHFNQESSKDSVTSNPSITVTNLNSLKQESILSSQSRNSAEAAATNTSTMHLTQTSIVSYQSRNSDVATHTSIMDFKRQASNHSGTSDIIISDPSNSTTDLKQESFQSVADSDPISLESPIQETSNGKDSDCSNLIVFPSKTMPLDSLTISLVRH